MWGSGMFHSSFISIYCSDSLRAYSGFTRAASACVRLSVLEVDKFSVVLEEDSSMWLRAVMVSSATLSSRQILVWKASESIALFFGSLCLRKSLHSEDLWE